PGTVPPLGAWEVAMYAGDIMQRSVVAVRAEDTFAEAARILREHRISSVIVQDGDRPVGIVTERDVVNAVADGLDPATTKVSDRMTRNLATIEPKTDIADAARVMAERRIRHLPVVDKGELVG